MGKLIKITALIAVLCGMFSCTRLIDVEGCGEYYYVNGTSYIITMEIHDRIYGKNIIKTIEPNNHYGYTSSNLGGTAPFYDIVSTILDRGDSVVLKKDGKMVHYVYQAAPTELNLFYPGFYQIVEVSPIRRIYSIIITDDFFKNAVPIP